MLLDFYINFFTAVGLVVLSLSLLLIYHRALVVNKTGQTTVDVNRYGEGWPEVVIFIMFLLLGIYKFILIATGRI